MANISFNEIYDTKVPGVYCEIDNSIAALGLKGKPSVGFLIGQKLSGVLENNKISGLITDPDQLIPLVGEGSELHRMAKAWKENNKQTPLYAIAAPQTEGVAAIYNLSVTASAVKAGQINLMIAGRRVVLTVSDEQTAADIVTAFISKINANKLIPAIAEAIPSEPDRKSVV